MNDKIPLGYQYLIQSTNNKCVPHFRASWLGSRHQTEEKANIQIIIYPKAYKLQNMEDPLDHLEFALKHEGFNLAIIEMSLQIMPKSAISKRISRKPTGVFERRLWYLYEALTGKILDLPDLILGNYVDLIDPKLYFTAEKPQLIKRQRIRHNLLGSFDFCPMVRKTETVNQWKKKDLNEQMLKLTKSVDSRVITRAIHYLFSKETLCSWEIEREKPSEQKAKRYIEQLKACASGNVPTKQDIIAWQNIIIDERFKETDYRTIQNYIGYMTRDFTAHVEYIPPKPEDIPRLMEGLLQMLFQDHQLAVILAAICSFGLVFIHPFKDGNGRLHRLLLHAILSQKGFTPNDMIFPLSATMLKHINEYEVLLQSYSQPLMKLIDYRFSDNQLQVFNDTFYLYRSWDMTKIVEYTYQCIEKTIDEEFQEEIDYLQGYDKAVHKIRSQAPLSDKEIDMLICFIAQNRGKLSQEKHRKFFSMLDDKTVKICETIVANDLNFKFFKS